MKEVGLTKKRSSANHQMNSPIAGWHSRDYLPHFDVPETIQHVTFHLADSLPKTVLQQMESELKTLSEAKRNVERRKRLEEYADAGHGSCVLRAPALAAMAQDSLVSFDSGRYRLIAWVVMPNHVHVLFQPVPGYSVSSIVASWKKFTARRICDELRAAHKTADTPIWHREYWDRYVRDAKHLTQAINYIHQNPVKAGLCATPEHWHWSSAFPGNANLPIGGVGFDAGNGRSQFP